MMKLFPLTLVEHLKRVCQPTLLGQTETRELRIFTSSAPPAVIYEVGSHLTDYFKSHSNEVSFVFKVGHSLFNHWKMSDQSEDGFPQKIADLGWVDKENHLTHYRNLKLQGGADGESLIIVLVGIDKATDNSSLKDFFVVDTESIWRFELKKSFIPWVVRLLSQYNIPAEKEHLKEIDEVLKTLFDYGIGDILKVAAFLEGIDLSKAQDAKDALREITENLRSWGLPLLRDIPSRRRASDYIKAAVEFFDYQKYLKESERKKALNKIQLFEQELSKGAIAPDFASEFLDVSDLLGCLRSYIETNKEVDKERLLRTNFVFIKDKILDLKAGKKSKRITRTIKKLEGSPLEVILTALWLTLVDFKKESDKGKLQSSTLLKSIHIEGLKFRHDFEQNATAREMIRGCLGGIDDYIEKYLQLGAGISDNAEKIELTCSLCPTDQLNKPPLERFGAGIPGFQFRVTFETYDDEFYRDYQWQLPETQPYRILWNLTQSVHEELGKGVGPCLPVFHIPYYGELFLASDEEEANRILKLSLNQLEITNLFELPELDQADALLPYLQEISFAFGQYISKYVEAGFFSAIEEPQKKLDLKFNRALRTYVNDDAVYTNTQLAPLLYKAFLFLSNQDSPTGLRIWDQYLDSAVVTGVHPALMEMVRHQNAFLFQSLIEKFNLALNFSSGLNVNEQLWYDACDLVTVHYPLFGILVGQDRILDTRITSMGLIHRMGEAPPVGSALSAKVLLRHDIPEDESITDSDLFRNTKESQVISRALHEYAQVHPHAHDGIIIAVLNVEDIQQIIAGVDTFLKNLLTEHALNWNDSPPYHLSLILFMTSPNNQTVSRHMREWRKRWQVDQETKKFEYYQKCRLSVSQRVISKEKWHSDYLTSISRPDFEADVAIIPHFITAGKTGNEFKEIEPFTPDYHSLKYPFIEIPQCQEKNPALFNHRARIISNRQFRIAALHSELSARFKHQNTQVGKEHVVISQGDFTPWVKIVDRLHQKAAWIVCIDSSIDERLIGQGSDPEKWKREVIGFASGLGAHGELNYTISTERASLTDIEAGVALQLDRLLGPWSQDQLEKAAHFLVKESRRLSGLSLVKATGVDRAIRDLMAYTLVRVSLPKIIIEDGLFLCDELVSLDSFNHWFDNAINKERADLLRIVAYLRSNHRIYVSAQLIECKLAQKSNAHLEKARIQLENGLYHLMSNFWPRDKEKHRFDQRYWWAQLVRLIANKSIVASKDQINVSTAMEKFIDGFFDISWQACAATFWTDQPDETYTLGTTWPFEFEALGLEIGAISCGNGLIHRICCDQEKAILPVPKSFIEIFAEDAQSKGSMSTKSATITATEIQEVDAPPQEPPSEQVEEKEPEEQNSDQVFVKEPKPTLEPTAKPLAGELAVPQRVFLGTAAMNRQIHWEFGHEGLPNRHLLIFGKSGTGKTYAIQAILYELGMAAQRSVIIDYTNGFLPNQLELAFREAINPKTHLVLHNPLPLNPFRRQQQIIEGFEPILEDSHTVGGRIASVINSVYSTIGEQQRATLAETVADSLDSFGKQMSFPLLLEQLKDRGTAGMNLANKLKPLVNMKLFTGELKNHWQVLYGDPICTLNIMQLAGVPRDIARIATEFILWDLYDYATSCGQRNIPLPVILDEIQNLDHRLDAPLGKFLTEGRKFGLCLILATQTLSNLKAEERDRLFQAAHKLFFKPAETEIKEYAKILESSQGEKVDTWVERLMSLEKGECYSLGPSLNTVTGKLEEKAFRIKINSFEDRISKTERQ